MKAPSLLTVPVARATAPSNMSKPAPTVATMPASSHHSSAASSPPNEAMPKPMSVSMFGRQPGARHRQRERLDARADARTLVGRDEGALAHDRHLASAEKLVLLLVEARERLACQAADDLAAGAAGLHEAGDPQPAQVPRDQRLAEVDVAHEVA